MKYLYIYLIIILFSREAFCQKSSLSLNIGGTVWISQFWAGDHIYHLNSCCPDEKFGKPNFLYYNTDVKEEGFLIKHSDINFIPVIELEYYVTNRFRVLSNLYGYNKKTEYRFGLHNTGGLNTTQSYKAWYKDKTIHLGLSLGGNYDLFELSNKHIFSVGLLFSLDKTVNRRILRDEGWWKMYPSSPEEEIKATDILPPYSGIEYFLFATASYELKFTENWKLKTRLKYNPNLSFTRNNGVSLNHGTIFTYRGIMAFDLQISYTFK